MSAARDEALIAAAREAVDGGHHDDACGYSECVPFGIAPEPCICGWASAKAKLLAALSSPPTDERGARPTVVTLCGSTRFMDEFFAAGWRETMAGRIVLSVGVAKHVETADGGHVGEALGPEVCAALDELHKRKIDLSDEILVLNVGGYVGESTASEIRYAMKTRKRVRWLDVLNIPEEWACNAWPPEPAATLTSSLVPPPSGAEAYSPWPEESEAETKALDNLWSEFRRLNRNFDQVTRAMVRYAIREAVAAATDALRAEVALLKQKALCGHPAACLLEGNCDWCFDVADAKRTAESGVSAAVAQAVEEETTALRDIVDAHKDCRHGRCRAWDQWRTNLLPSYWRELSEYCYDNIALALRSRVGRGKP